MNESVQEDPQVETEDQQPQQDVKFSYYRFRFREYQHIQLASSKINNLTSGEIVMLQTDHGQEPGRIFDRWVPLPLRQDNTPLAEHSILRRATRDEVSKYENLLERESEATQLCKKLIHKLNLVMKLVGVERYFNGSKIIFYFTADTRVDFRELVKELVQEFRTRVEMRQIGVRHETKMVGGLGCCGRELCCCSFMKKFSPVSIKMAKEQDLPLNPSKISGICNRLLCCLNHEFEAYKYLKKNMPRSGKSIALDDKIYKVVQCNALKGIVTAIAQDGTNEMVTLEKAEWSRAEQVVGKKNAKEVSESSTEPDDALESMESKKKKSKDGGKRKERKGNKP